ncbi:MAG TPA: M13 family metallopeptidase [Gemmatimonadaceae bacterium]|jgi:putative endopeptidase
MSGHWFLGWHRVARTLFLLVMMAGAAPSLRAQRQQSVARLDQQLAPLRVVDVSMIDTTAKACDDFFQFANGAWLARDTIPAAYPYSGVSRDMADRNELVIRAVLEDAMAKRSSPSTNSTTRKLGTFYASCMDSVGAEAKGATTMRPLLNRVDAVSSRAQLLGEMAELQMNGAGALFGYGPSADAHDAAHYIVWLVQAGLGMPDRDYYTDQGPAADSLRTAYVQHIAKILTLAGDDGASAAGAADRIMALETELAKASTRRVDLRDPAATDHPMTTAELAALVPNVDWPAYFHSIGLSAAVTKVNVANPEFFKRANELLASTPISDWRAYLRFHALAPVSPWLSAPFVNEDFAFSSRFSGAKELLPRWKRCARETDRMMGEALGQAYVTRTFPPEARARARAVIDDIRVAFHDRLLRLTWMSDSTRAQALDKLAKMSEKVGYPDRWRDYSRLVVGEGAFALNVQRASSFEWHRVVNRPGLPVDKTEWSMTVPTVNAYYDATVNEMVFPAGALVPQTFDPAADDAANYGSLGGSWAGHELTHGFDDEGRHYDAAGNLRDWWIPADSVHFSEQAAMVVRQYTGYIQVDTFHVNGRLTLGENIADFGGVLTGYDALQRALERTGRPGRLEGYSPEQRFFIAYAQSYRQHNRPAYLRTRVTLDPHSPEQWRVNAPLSNMPEFAQAFGCKPGDSMVRPSEVVPRIW